MQERDEVIVERLRKGDTEAFAELVSAYRKPVYALVAGKSRIPARMGSLGWTPPL